MNKPTGLEQIERWVELEERAMCYHRLRQRLQSFYGARKAGVMVGIVSAHINAIRFEQEQILTALFREYDWSDAL